MDHRVFEELWRRNKFALQKLSRRVSGGNQQIADDALHELRQKLGRPDVMAKYDAAKASWRTWAGSVLKHLVIDHLRAHLKGRPRFRVTKETLELLERDGVPAKTIQKLLPLLDDPKPMTENRFQAEVAKRLSSVELELHWKRILEHAAMRKPPDPAPPAARDDEILENLDREQFRADLRDCLQQLTSEQRQIVEWRDNQGWTFQRIADELGYPDHNRVYQLYRSAKERLIEFLREKGWGEQ